MAEFKHVVTAHVRLARLEDMPHVLALIQQLADFERLTEMCVATVPKLEATLLKHGPFQGPTVLLLELSTSLVSSTLSSSSEEGLGSVFQETAREIELRSPIQDPQALAFRSGEERTIAGFVLFFPNYSTFLATPGFYIEDLYVRECFRGHGFGTLLLKTVAQLAVKLDYGRVEWCVLDWNQNAIKFYESMGAKMLHEWRICRLTGEALGICGSQD